jgi:hypothetical protein
MTDTVSPFVSPMLCSYTQQKTIPDQQHYFIFTGRIRLWRLQPDGTTTPRLYDGHDHVILPPYTPHWVEAVNDDNSSSSSSSAVIMAAWSSSTSVTAPPAPPARHEEQQECDYYTFQPYDDLAAQQQRAGHTATTMEDTFHKSSSSETDNNDSSFSPWKQFPAIAKMFQAVGKNKVFWVGMATGISFGFWFGSRRRR